MSLLYHCLLFTFANNSLTRYFFFIRSCSLGVLNSIHNRKSRLDDFIYDSLLILWKKKTYPVQPIACRFQMTVIVLRCSFLRRISASSAYSPGAQHNGVVCFETRTWLFLCRFHTNEIALSVILNLVYLCIIWIVYQRYQIIICITY